MREKFAHRVLVGEIESEACTGANRWRSRAAGFTSAQGEMRRDMGSMRGCSSVISLPRLGIGAHCAIILTKCSRLTARVFTNLLDETSRAAILVASR